MPTIDVVVSPTGETQIQTHGFAGPTYQAATKALETALGLKQSETLTPDYHLPVIQDAGLAAQFDPAG